MPWSYYREKPVAHGSLGIHVHIFEVVQPNILMVVSFILLSSGCDRSHGIGQWKAKVLLNS